jgi:hypothetical protein
MRSGVGTPSCSPAIHQRANNLKGRATGRERAIAGSAESYTEWGSTAPLTNQEDTSNGCQTDHLLIIFQAGTHNDTMRIRYADFARLVKPTVVDIACSPRITAGHY